MNNFNGQFNLDGELEETRGSFVFCLQKNEKIYIGKGRPGGTREARQACVRTARLPARTLTSQLFASLTISMSSPINTAGDVKFRLVSARSGSYERRQPRAY